VPSVTRPCGRLVLGFLRRQATRRDEGLPVRLVHGDDRSIDSEQQAGGVDRPRQDLLEVERATELGDRSTASAFPAGSLDGAGQLARRRLQPPAAREEQCREHGDERAERRGDRRDERRHEESPLELDGPADMASRWPLPGQVPQDSL